MRVAVGCDHAGEALMVQLLDKMRQQWPDCRLSLFSPPPQQTVDYPLIAQQVCRCVQSATVDWGLLICGSGTGMAMAANRLGVRAANCSHEWLARMARAHNDAQILCLGQRLVGCDLAWAMVEIFATTAFTGGRHAKRIAMIDQGINTEVAVDG